MLLRPDRPATGTFVPAWLVLSVLGASGGCSATTDDGVTRDAGTSESASRDGASGSDASVRRDGTTPGDARDDSPAAEATVLDATGDASKLALLRAALAGQVTASGGDASTLANAQQGFYIALGLLEVDGDASRAEPYLQRALAYQVADAGASNYGCFLGSDANATSFASLPLIVVWDRWQSALSAALDAELKQSLTAAGHCLESQPINQGVLYTNIWLQTSVSLLLIGEAILDTSLEDVGYSQLAAWYGLTKEAGVAEYVSPTYTALDLASLDMAYLFAKRPGASARVGQTLDFLWSDVKANVLPFTGNLAGAHSRDYDWMQGIDDTSMNLWLWFEAGQPSLSTLGGSLAGQLTSLENIFLYVNAVAGGYHPDWAALPVSSHVDGGRFISESWPVTLRDGGAPAIVGLRQNYVTPGFALGHSEPSTAGLQDKNINLSVASSKRAFSNITVVLDHFGDPYGLDDWSAYHPVVDGGANGSTGREHIALNPASAQSGGALLTTYLLHASGEYPSLSTNVLLPINADKILLNGAPLPDAGMTPVAAGSWIEILEGTTAVALQLLVLDRVAGVAGHAELVVDSFSRSNYIEDQIPQNLDATTPTHALRLAYYHYQDGPLPDGGGPPTFVRGVVLLFAETLANPSAFTQFVSQTQALTLETFTADGGTAGTEWGARIDAGPGMSLSVKRSFTDPYTVLETVNDQAVSPSVFTVNGADLRAQLPFFQ